MLLSYNSCGSFAIPSLVRIIVKIQFVDFTKAFDYIQTGFMVRLPNTDK